MIEPSEKRVMAFVDGQNLFNAAKRAFGYSFPNYDPLKLARLVCGMREGWYLDRLYFYTGIPSQKYDVSRNKFWVAKLAAMGKNKDVQTFSRELVYRNGVGQEKGIDVRLALDITRLARQGAYDVALIFSQDQDLSEVAKELQGIVADNNRWVKVASAFPIGTGTLNRRGINGTDWITIDKTLYDAAIDQANYRKYF